MFLAVVQTIFQRCRDEGLDEDSFGVWFDTFSVNQHSGIERFDHWANSFKLAIRKIGQAWIILIPYRAAVWMSRSWCLFEFWAIVDGCVTFKILLPAAEEALCSTNAADAICMPAEEALAADATEAEAPCTIAEEALAADATEAEALCTIAEEALAADATAADTVCATAEDALALDALRFSSAIALTAFLLAVSRKLIIVAACIIDGLATTPPESGEYVMYTQLLTS
jgi:hypothetical protein